MGDAGFVFWGAFVAWALVIGGYVIWLWRVER